MYNLEKSEIEKLHEEIGPFMTIMDSNGNRKGKDQGKGMGGSEAIAPQGRDAKVDFLQD